MACSVATDGSADVTDIVLLFLFKLSMRIGDHQYGFRRNRSTTDHISSIRQILEKKWEYNEAVHQLFIDFKKVSIELGIPMKLVRHINMCPTETYSRVWVDKNLSDMLCIRNGLGKMRCCITIAFQLCFRLYH